MERSILLISIVVGFLYGSDAQSLTADDLIQKSITYHDPDDRWEDFQYTFTIRQESPQHSGRVRTVHLDREYGSFNFLGKYTEGELEYKVEDGEGIALWNGSDIIADSIQTKYRVSPDRAIMYRNYYLYLYGLPMKLLDPGTVVHPQVDDLTFHGKELYRIKITYNESVGTDTWYFYFDKVTFALGAYEFWKSEPGDGEYLLLEGVRNIGGVMMPERIKWFVTEDDRWLGTDILVDKE